MESKGGSKSARERETTKVKSREVEAEVILSHQELQNHHGRDHFSFRNICLHKILDWAQLTLNDITRCEENEYFYTFFKAESSL